jgi:hypothetical protein
LIFLAARHRHASHISQTPTSVRHRILRAYRWGEWRRARLVGRRDGRRLSAEHGQAAQVSCAAIFATKVRATPSAAALTSRSLLRGTCLGFGCRGSVRHPLMPHGYAAIASTPRADLSAEIECRADAGEYQDPFRVMKSHTTGCSLARRANIGTNSAAAGWRRP